MCGTLVQPEEPQLLEAFPLQAALACSKRRQGEQGREEIVRVMELLSRLDIGQDAHRAEETDVLEGAGHAQANDLVRRVPGDILAREANCALGGVEVPTQQIEDGGLASAVRPDNPKDLACPQSQLIIVHSRKTAKDLLEANDLKKDTRRRRRQC